MIQSLHLSNDTHLSEVCNGACFFITVLYIQWENLNIQHVYSISVFLVHQPDADVGWAPDSTSTIPSFINIYLCSFQKETDDLPLETSTVWLYWWVPSLTSKSLGCISQQEKIKNWLNTLFPQQHYRRHLKNKTPYFCRFILPIIVKIIKKVFWQTFFNKFLLLIAICFFSQLFTYWQEVFRHSYNSTKFDKTTLLPLLWQSLKNPVYPWSKTSNRV